MDTQTVYVVTCQSFYASTMKVLAVCLTEEKAKQVIAEDNTSGHFDWEYEKMEITK